jgi:hypothetical protein
VGPALGKWRYRLRSGTLPARFQYKRGADAAPFGSRRADLDQGIVNRERQRLDDRVDLRLRDDEWRCQQDLVAAAAIDAAFNSFLLAAGVLFQIGVEGRHVGTVGNDFNALDAPANVA